VRRLQQRQAFLIDVLDSALRVVDELEHDEAVQAFLLRNIMDDNGENNSSCGCCAGVDSTSRIPQ
jgi:hypothetical protein